MNINHLFLLFLMIATPIRSMEKEPEPFDSDLLRKIMACSDLNVQKSFRCANKALSRIYAVHLIKESPLIMSRKDHLDYMVYFAKEHLIKDDYEATIKNLIHNASNCNHEDLLDLLILFEKNIQPVLDDTDTACLTYIAIFAGDMLSTLNHEELTTEMLKSLAETGTKLAIQQMIRGNRTDLKKIHEDLPSIVVLIQKLRKQLFAHIDTLFDKIVALYRGDPSAIEQCMYAIGEIHFPDKVEKYKANPLLVAVKANSAIMTELLLAQSHDLINESNRDGFTPLLLVSDPDICKMLLACKEIQPNKRPQRGNACGVTPLYNAINHDYKEIQKLLLAHPNFIINEEDNGIPPACMTPLHTAAYNGNLHVFRFFFNHTNKGAVRSVIHPIHIATRGGYYEIVKLIINHDPTQINLKNKDEETPLHLAATYNNLRLVRLLLKKGAHRDALNKNSETPLWRACKKGHIDIVKKLLQYDANINTQDKFNRSPLMIAIDKEHVNIAKHLIKHGADINQQYNCINALYFAVYREQQELINLLMENPELQLNREDTTSFTPLHQAANCGHAHVFEFFLNLTGGFVDNVTKPIHFAADTNQTEIIQMILDFDKRQIDLQDDCGNTALHAATLYGNFESVQLLIENGANMEIVNNNGKTALAIAYNHDHDEIVELLLASGANFNCLKNVQS